MLHSTCTRSQPNPYTLTQALLVHPWYRRACIRSQQAGPATLYARFGCCCRWRVGPQGAPSFPSRRAAAQRCRPRAVGCRLPHLAAVVLKRLLVVGEDEVDLKGLLRDLRTAQCSGRGRGSGTTVVCSSTEYTKRPTAFFGGFAEHCNQAARSKHLHAPVAAANAPLVEWRAVAPTPAHPHTPRLSVRHSAFSFRGHSPLLLLPPSCHARTHTHTHTHARPARRARPVAP